MIAGLAARFGFRYHISFEHTMFGPAVRLETHHGLARVLLKGAQVIDWSTRDHDAILWTSSREGEHAATPPSPPASQSIGKPLRGGIPVCWPWFGSDRSGTGRPAHGFVRGAPWTVRRTACEPAETASITLEADVAAAGAGFDPPDARLTLTVTLSDCLGLRLRTTNLAREPLTISQALHTYFRIGDIDRVAILGLDGCGYLDALDGFAERVQSGPVRLSCEVDRIYVDMSEAARTRTITVRDLSRERSILVTSQGSASAVIWNPWIEKSQRLGDMAADDYRRMVCVETANAASDAVTIGPGLTHTLAVDYRVGPLDPAAPPSR